MMRAPTPAIRRLCLVIDMAGYSKLGNVAALDAQSRILTIVRSVCRRARISLSRMIRQDRGDGIVLLLPVGVDEARVVAALVLGLRNALHTANLEPDDWGVLRLRAALTQGVVHTGALGYAGRAVVEACRLVDVPELKHRLRDTDTSDLAVIVSDDLFHDVVAQDYPGLPSAGFEAVQVALKEYSGTAWISLAPRGPAADPYASASTDRLTAVLAVGVMVTETTVLFGDELWDMLTAEDAPEQPGSSSSSAPEHRLRAGHEDPTEAEHEDDEESGQEPPPE